MQILALSEFALTIEAESRSHKSRSTKMCMRMSYGKRAGAFCRGVLSSLRVEFASELEEGVACGLTKPERLDNALAMRFLFPEFTDILDSILSADVSWWWS